jgi:hypothetical protein
MLCGGMYLNFGAFEVLGRSMPTCLGREKKMKFLQDDVLGKLAYDYGWTREYTYPLMGRTVAVTLVIPCDDGAKIEEAQREAFARFDASKDRLMISVERSIFDYYRSICDAYRERLGVEFADARAPKIHDIGQLASLVNPTELIVQQSFKSGARIIGLLFRCSWDPELGLAVRLVDEQVDEVGAQDIVL